MSQLKISNEIVGGAIGAAVVGLTMFTGLLNATNTAGAIIGVGAGWVVGAAVASYMAVRADRKQKAILAAAEEARLKAEREDPYRAVLLWATERISKGDFVSEAPDLRALLSTISETEQSLKQSGDTLDDLKRIVRLDLQSVLAAYVVIREPDRDLPDSEGITPRARFQSSLNDMRATIKHLHLRAHEENSLTLRSRELNVRMTRQQHVGIDGQRVDLDE